MRVLHIFDHSAPLQSGYSFRSLAILREQEKLGWQTFQLTSPKQGAVAAEIEEAAGLRFYRTRAGTSWTDRVPVLGELCLMRLLRLRLRDVARALRPHVLHAHSPLLDAFPAIAVGSELGIPVVYEVRSLWEDSAVEKGHSRIGSPKYRATRLAETQALRRADHVIVISAGLRDEFVGRGIAAKRLTVMPNGVDLDRFPVVGERDAELASRLGLTHHRVIGYAGSLHRYEGLDILIEAFVQALAQLPDLRLLLIGDGAEAGRLRDLARDRGVADRVVFTGQVPHRTIPAHLSLMSALVYPRRPSRLTDIVTPLKPLEAMAQGIAVIASDIGGHRELIPDPSVGHLVPPEDARALRDAIVAVVGSEARRRETIVAAREFVSRERTWARSVARCRIAYAAAGVPQAALDSSEA